MGEPNVIFTDRQGDRLEVIIRDRSEYGNPIPDPVITIVDCGGKYETKHSIVMNDKELDTVIRDMCEKFGYIATKKDCE